MGNSLGAIAIAKPNVMFNGLNGLNFIDGDRGEG